MISHSSFALHYFGRASTWSNLMASSTSMTASSKKRVADHSSEGESSSKKKQKAHPFFTKQAGADSDKTPSTFQWLTPFGPKRTCLHGTNLMPKIVYSDKVAAFDLDGTLIESTFSKGKKSAVKASASTTFAWWNKCVPAKLEEVFKAGHSIVIVSNQATGPKKVEEWRKKIASIAAALPEVPFRILTATAKDGYRKPMPGMWYLLEDLYRKEGVQIDKKSSFFVGDAAGRPNDFAGTDRKWAINAELPFFTPEEYFLGKPGSPFSLTGFNVSSLKEVTPLVPSLSTKPEIAVFVGHPSSGKSSFYRKHFEPAGYVHINQDILGTRPRCIKATQEAIEIGKSCVIDNTNRNVQTRKFYIDLGIKLQVPVRCFKFESTMQLAWHNNLYRAYNLPPSIAEQQPKRDVVPYLAFTSFESNYEDPQVKEGFSEVIVVEWVFEGSEEERRRWTMWHQVDGK